MKLMTEEMEKKLAQNKPGALSNKPYLKLFNPLGNARWLITEYYPETGILYGLCDLGFGSPEIGSVSIEELEETHVGLGLGIERDILWSPEKTLTEYANEAREAGRIVL